MVLASCTSTKTSSIGRPRALESSLGLCQDGGDKRGEALSVAMLGTVSRVQGRDDEALERVEHALAIAAGEGERHIEAQLSCTMAVMKLMQGRLDEAELWFDGALSQASALGDGIASPSCCGGSAGCTIDVVIRTRRCDAWSRRWPPSRHWPTSRAPRTRCWKLGRVYAGQHDRDWASPALERAAALFHRHGDRQDEAACWQLIGDLDAAAGVHHLAHQHRGRALRLWQMIGDINQTKAPARPSSP